MTHAKNAQPQEPDEQTSIGHQVRLGAGIVAMAALLLFFLQNLQEVQMHFLWFDWNTRLIFALLASSIVGGIASWFMGAFRRRGRRVKKPDA